MRWWTEESKISLPSARETSGRRPLARKRRTASRAIRKPPVRLVPITAFQSSRVMSASAASFWRPAFETTISTGPSRPAASSKRRATSASVPTSPCTAIARRPSASIIATVSSAPSFEP